MRGQAQIRVSSTVRLSAFNRTLAKASATPAGANPKATHQDQPSPLLAAALDAMLARYWGRAPTSDAVRAFVEQRFAQPGMAHDHFAFRTFGVRGQGIASLGGALEAFGYSRQEYYTFPRKRLLATWYAPPAALYDALPRVFVSELQVEQLSPSAQAIIGRYAADSLDAGFCVTAAWTAALTGVLPWRAPAWEDYTALLRESEYAAWVLANGYQLNHTALSVHRLTRDDGDLAAFASLLAAEGFALNGEGGVIKASPDGLLLQCSTVADAVEQRFADGQVHAVAGPYLEFVERRALPQHAHLGRGLLRERHRRDGFETDSADKIFESTTLAAAGLQHAA